MGNGMSENNFNKITIEIYIPIDEPIGSAFLEGLGHLVSNSPEIIDQCGRSGEYTSRDDDLEYDVFIDVDQDQVSI